MPPRKRRRCRPLGGSRGMKPMGIPRSCLKEVYLELDEFEALRLCDSEGMNQIEAAQAMGISRGTVQRLLTSGRKKMVDSLLHLHSLILRDQVTEYQ